MSTNSEAESETVDGKARSIDSCTTVVVPTGGGERFHRPGTLGFEAACKTEFGHPTREVTVAEARRCGFSPCESAACFGDR